MKFRKKPVLIEAFQYTEGFHISDAPNEFKNAVIVLNLGSKPHSNRPHIKTLEGDHEVTLGDWIIKGVKGEFYPCKPDIFKMTYEQICNACNGVGQMEDMGNTISCFHCGGSGIVSIEEEHCEK